jgi:hypothetical protein
VLTRTIQALQRSTRCFIFEKPESELRECPMVRLLEPCKSFVLLHMR